MLLRGKPAEDWTKDDLLALTGELEQGRSLEFKRELHLRTSDEKQEFLADVTSFANAAGGHILYGVAEEDGCASAVPGFEPDQGNVDDLLQRIENVVRDSVQPRLPGFTIYPPVHMEDERWALIVEVARSWAGPHAVKGSHNALRFYTRNSAGKRSLDVAELRAAFLLSESLAERIRSFRIERLGRIEARETPTPVPETPKAVLHIVPLLSFEPGASVPTIDALGMLSRQGFPSGGHQDTRLNLDGVLSYQTAQLNGGEIAAVQYRQLFRTGVVEAVHTQLAYQSPRYGRVIQPGPTEEWLIKSCTTLLPILQELGQEPPLLIMPSFLGFAGYTIPQLDVHGFPVHTYPIDRQLVDLPEILLETYVAPAQVLDALRPTLDTLWNAAGHLEWPNCDHWHQQLLAEVPR